MLCKSPIVATIQLSLKLITCACKNYTTQNLSENSHDIGRVCTKDQLCEYMSGSQVYV